MASKLQTVLEALQVALEADTASTVYSPDVVQITDLWPLETDLDASRETIYLVVPENETGGPGPESCSIDERTDIFIMPATRFTSPTENPFGQDPPRWRVKADLIADVKEKLRVAEDTKLDGTVITLFDQPVNTDFVRFLPKWVIPEMRIRVRYRYEKTDR